VTEMTAQDASGATIARSADLRVVRVFSAGESEGSRGRPHRDLVERSRTVHGRRGRGRWRTRGRRERAHRSLENRGRFSTSAHRHHRLIDLRRITRQEITHGHQPADDNNRVPPVVADTPMLTFAGRNSCR
jgi:hypothetical protein